MYTIAKNNIRYIDLLKAFAIILVVLGHINFANQVIKAWIYAFHMPVFFFSSGLLLKTKPGDTIRNELSFGWKKFENLMIPYFIWAVIYSTPDDTNLIYILYGSHQSLARADSLTSLWFLPVLFITMVLFACSRYAFKGSLNQPVKLILAVIALTIGRVLPNVVFGYPWGVNLAFPAFGFLMLGNMLFPVIQSTRQAMNSKSNFMLSVLVLCLCFAGTLLYRLNIPSGGYINVANAEWGNYFLFFIFACVGIGFMVALSLVTDCLLGERRSRVASVFSFIGKNTMCIFATHKLFIRLFKRVFSLVRVPDAISLVVTCSGTVALCCLVALFINRYLPTLAGKVPERAISSR